jgi:membrane-associated phospholipid phosphatase
MLCGGAVILAVLLLPFDGAISTFVTQFRPGGDLKRELELLQQFGSPTTMIVCALLIWRLDPRMLARMLDWLLAAGLTWAAVFALKVSLGRPRPKFLGEHLNFLGPWNTYTVQEGDPPRHAWEILADDVTEIWSMPSSHTAFAVVAAVCLTRMYPRLRPIAIVMALLVGVCRVLLKAHYPSDVLVGAAIGYAIAEVCMSRSLGVRLMDRIKVSGRD